MRFVRLRSGTQAMMIAGGALFVGWTVIVTSIFLIDTISAGSARDQAARAQMSYQTRLNALSEERNARASEARLAQDRFAIAMDQVSDMQSHLLESEERRREMETAVDVIQTTLRRTMAERDEARARADQLYAEIQAETGTIQTAAGRQRDMEQTLAFLADALEDTATERDDAHEDMEVAHAEVDRLEFEAELAAERNERIFTQIEEAVAMSLEPLDNMFRSAGMPTDQIIDQVRRGYSGQGGPLMPITMSTRGQAPDPMSLRANEVLEGLDQVNLHRMAAEQLPFAMPVQSSVRFTSGFGYRRDPINGGRRLHAGADFAGPVGTPLYAAGDGVVIFAGRQSGYGLMVKIQHPFGIETRYAHMSRIGVSQGQRVSRGDRIGDMGRTGRVTGSHLHYEVRQNGTPINPMNFITAGRDVF
ncbi:peptidoglycan DD-metalloendopeptidase family protein [Roseobacter sp. HKCCD9010]|nr:peptidoglycan DD-metalloendopeptidase family protein [Rhodobacterales bacterium HKCCD4356]NNV11878.1 peptidoglycan DD-metalloendopeptidase family protein [Roseobacter sp. HKCCD7357]NNV18029.1 peptidoglycan DD-metalloendopeptidase family protein [Roseobacter sp. HKCCD8768]NNV26120.1 peptidoglycan DD-metalloendopeptidase family protein [Roseobacter sp. HKCCD8192]NNV31756.1 peptidoglycan DD-metalloendopeptidase family protein [Roseobacter sp. HKCCD9061]NNV35844.1 peptidoglycan DD-metalloendope